MALPLEKPHEFPGDAADALPRDYRHYRSDRKFDAILNGLSPPSVVVLFIAFYGENWRKIMSLTFARRYNTICAIARGQRALPRQMLEHMLLVGSDAKATADFISGERARFEWRLAKRLERRAAAVRWCRLILSGDYSEVYRFTKRRPRRLFRSKDRAIKTKA